MGLEADARNSLFMIADKLSRILNGDPDAPIRGMTLRDYFAAKAMQGIVASYANPQAMNIPDAEDVSRWSRWVYQYADAMLAAAKEES